MLLYDRLSMVLSMENNPFPCEVLLEMLGCHCRHADDSWDAPGPAPEEERSLAPAPAPSSDEAISAGATSKSPPDDTFISGTFPGIPGGLST